jgi:hypothetical protein
MTVLANINIFKKEFTYLSMFKIHATAMIMGFVGPREAWVEFWLVEECCEGMMFWVDGNLI